LTDRDWRRFSAECRGDFGVSAQRLEVAGCTWLAGCAILFGYCAPLGP
jgi:hypothetical protein